MPNNRVDAENEACHGSCLRNTRARHSFPVTTGVNLESKTKDINDETTIF